VEAANGQHLYTHSTQYRIFAAPWSPHGSHIASGSFDATVQSWDAFTGDKCITYSGHAGPVYAVAWSFNAQHIASAGQDSTVHIWLAATAEASVIYRGHRTAVKSLAWSSRDAIASEAMARRTDLVRPHGEHHTTLSDHPSWIRSLAFSPAGTILAVASDTIVRLWPLDQ